MNKCADCSEPGYRRYRREARRCVKHQRFLRMRDAARGYGKHVPSRDQLDAMLLSLTPSMTCPLCSVRMNWQQADGASTVITLQHDRVDPTSCRLICLGCNSRHSSLPGDLYYEIPRGQKWCGRCDRVLPFESFCRAPSRSTGITAHCKACTSRDRKAARKAAQKINA